MTPAQLRASQLVELSKFLTMMAEHRPERLLDEEISFLSQCHDRLAAGDTLLMSQSTQLAELMHREVSAIEEDQLLESLAVCLVHLPYDVRTEYLQVRRQAVRPGHRITERQRVWVANRLAFALYIKSKLDSRTEGVWDAENVLAQVLVDLQSGDLTLWSDDRAFIQEIQEKIATRTVFELLASDVVRLIKLEDKRDALIARKAELQRDYEEFSVRGLAALEIVELRLAELRPKVRKVVEASRARIANGQPLTGAQARELIGLAEGTLDNDTAMRVVHAYDFIIHGNFR